jgi:NAD(P)-dependent dehydrogenase (short-subunit alcohol dehydrogenase family)
MSVVMTDINAEGVHEAAAEVAARHGTPTLAVPSDVSSEDEVAAMMRRCEEEFGVLHALVNNAGVDVCGPPHAVVRDMWSRVHDVDLWGPMLLVREAESLLARQGGSVVNIASTHALATVAGRSAYAAAKAGMLGLTRGLAIDLGPRNIRVNSVLPGYIRTPIWRLWLDDAPDPDALLATIAGRHPVRRLGRPEDVAGLVAFLCSDDAGFITGAAYVIDGGYTSLLEYPTE